MNALASTLASSVAPSVVSAITGALKGSKSNKKKGGGNGFLREMLDAKSKSGLSSTTSRRGKRRRGRSRIPKPLNGSRSNSVYATNDSKVVSAPVAITTGISCTEDQFKTRPVRHKTHGPGSSCAFSVVMSQIATDGVGANQDNILPFVIGSFPIVGPGSGFIDLAGTNVSGINLHPVFFGLRMQHETNSWTRYIWKWIKATYVPFVPTSTAGSLTMAMSRDPCSFFEAGNTQSQPKPQYGFITQQIPFGVSPLYYNCSVGMVNKEDTPLYCEWASGTPFTKGNDVGTAAYNRSCMFGRLAGFLQNVSVTTAGSFGNMWLEGEIEFYQPSVSQLTISTTFATNLFLDEKQMEKLKRLHEGDGPKNIYCCGRNRYFSTHDEFRDFISDPFSDGQIETKKSLENSDLKVSHKVKPSVSWEDDILPEDVDSPVLKPVLNTGLTNPKVVKAGIRLT